MACAPGIRPAAVETIELREAERPLRVLAVLPLPDSKSGMIHAIREVASLEVAGVTCQSFLVASRTSPRMLLREWHRLRKEIRAFQPDLLHAHYGTMTAFLAIVSTALPVIITYRGSDLNPNPGLGWLRQAVGTLLSQIAALRAARIICVSNQLKNKLWWRKNRVRVIPGGVDTTVFYPRHSDEARRELGWGQDERVVLFNGRDAIIKRLDLARAAVQFAESVCGKIRFVILDGDVSPTLIPSMLNAADCLLVTSDWEGSPYIVKEAIACNLPVVSVDVGDVREQLHKVLPSVIVSRDVSEIGRGITEILRHRQRSNGGELINDWSSEVNSQRIISLYRAAQGIA